MLSIIKIVKILIIILSSTNFIESFLGQPNYFSLILNVHRYFSTSCVFLIHDREESLMEFARLKELMYNFSSVDVLAISIEFERVYDTMKLYGNSVVRPLVVVSLGDRRMLDEFIKLMGNVNNAAGPCWLLLFDEKVYLASLPSESGDNIFNLQFNTEMLIARSNHTNIQEWYWLNNKVITEDLAVWDFETGFTLRTDDSLYERRSTLQGHLLPVTTLHNPPILTFVNNSIGGFCGAMLLELAKVADFEIKFVSPRVKSYGSWNNSTQKWSGMIEVLVNQEASIAVAEFTMSAIRTEAIDFTLPLITTRDKLFIRKPETGVHWSSYWQTLTPGNWIVIQGLILVTTVLLTFITFVGESKITPDVISEYLLLVFGIYCQQGLPEFPSDTPSRIVYFSIFLSAMVVLAAYSAALISFLTITTVTLPFSTLEGFVEDGTYNLIVFRDGAEFDMFMTSREPTMAKMRLLLNKPNTLPRNLKEGFEQVCSQRVALYLPGALEEAYRMSLPCKLEGIDTRRSMSLAMALSKNNPYNGLINYHVQKFRDYGLLDRLKRMYTVEVDPPDTIHVGVTAVGIVPILIILTFGIVLAILILFIEKLSFKQASRESTDPKNRRLIKTSKNYDEKIFKIRLRHRTEYLTPSKHFYP